MYQPKQGDIVWINFDPSKGREIKKRRPAVVVSSDNYNKATGFVIVTPITSKIRSNPVYVDITSQKTKGQVVTTQIYSLDVSSRSNRDIEYIEKLRQETYYKVVQLIQMSFDFGI